MPNTLDSHLTYTDIEWKTNQYFKNIVRFLNSKQVENILDAGGCTGRVTTILIEEIPTIKSATILEPVKDNYNYIVENTKKYQQVVVINKALFYGKKFIQLGQCDDNVGGWSFKHTNNKTNNVSTTTLEDFENIEFLKMDIEGAEKNVIPNSSYIHEIPYLEIEFHDELMETWEEYSKINLPNHVLKFDASPERANGFFIRKDLFE